MTSKRDRVLAVLRHEEIEIAPLDAPGVHEDVITSAGETVEGFHRYMEDAGVKSLFGQPRLEPYLAKNIWDVQPGEIDYSEYFARMDPPVTSEDRYSFFGSVNGPGTPTFNIRPMRYPLGGDISERDIDEFPWFRAEKSAMGRWDGIKYRSETEQLKADDRVVIGRAGHPFEWAWMVRGYENLLVDMAEESDRAVVLLDRVTARYCDYARFFAVNGAEGIYLADDIAHQRGLMMSLEMLRRWIKPMYGKIIDAARQVDPDIFFIVHCCGDCSEFIPDYIDLGLDLLNPIQPEAMDVTRVYREHHQHLSLWRALGVQSTFAFGTPEDVGTETEHLVELSRGSGGMIIGPAHSIEPGTPLENVYAYIETAAKYL